MIPAKKAFIPGELGRAFRGVMGADVTVVEGVGQGVLGDDIEITPVEVRITLCFFKALTKNHVCRHKPARVGAAEDKAVPWEINQHVVPVHPAEPMIALGAIGK